MKRILVFGLALLLAGMTLSSFMRGNVSPDAGRGGDEILGIWLTQKKDSKVEISKNQDNTYSGKLIWVAPPHQSFEGTLIMKEMTYNVSGENFDCPWIYDPRLNITARATVTIAKDTMYVKARKGIFSKNEIFTRVK